MTRVAYGRSRYHRIRYSDCSLTSSWKRWAGTRNRKRLRPNDVAEWELRIGKYRVFYDVYEKARTVKVEGIGHKEGNRLFLHGEEYKL